MNAQWQRVDPAEHDYDDRLLVDGYLKVYVHPQIKSHCESCGVLYAHFFVAHADWARVTLPERNMQLCVSCYVAALP